MIKVFATDLDGTLLFPKKKIRMISSSNRRYLRNLENKGIKIVFVTGRNIRFCQKLAKRIKVQCDFITDSGGRITIQDKTHKMAAIPNDIALDITQVLQENELKAVLAIATENSEIYSNAWAQGKLWEMFLKTYSLKDLFLSQRIHVTKRKFNYHINRVKILKITIIFRKKYQEIVQKYMDEMAHKYPEQLEFAYGNNYLEITSYRCNKAHALTELIDYYNITKDEVIVVGDEGNDYEMIKQFPNSFAMEQGSELIKEVAQHVIGRIRDIDKFIKL